ncbi:MAG: hypothetical protein LBT40_02810 [Deltaproteobacteria bacterium]|jgi:hypothetical protein|nr:hypothetical protein [Deltaproteobacteria bacterium]
MGRSLSGCRAHSFRIQPLKRLTPEGESARQGPVDAALVHGAEGSSVEHILADSSPYRSSGAGSPARGALPVFQEVGGAQEYVDVNVHGKGDRRLGCRVACRDRPGPGGRHRQGAGRRSEGKESGTKLGPGAGREGVSSEAGSRSRTGGCRGRSRGPEPDGRASGLKLGPGAGREGRTVTV